MRPLKTLLFALPVSLLLTNCGAKRYYTLGDTSHVQSTENYQKTITVEKIEIPKYLKDTAIVKQVSPYQVELIEDANWLNPMQKHLTNVLISYLQKSLNDPNVYLYPWENSSKQSKRISLKIKKFIAYEERVTLEARYQIYEASTKQERTKLFSTQVPTQESTESIMKSMEKAYFQLAEEIKREILK